MGICFTAGQISQSSSPLYRRFLPEAIAYRSLAWSSVVVVVVLGTRPHFAIAMSFLIRKDILPDQEGQSLAI